MFCAGFELLVVVDTLLQPHNNLDIVVASKLHYSSSNNWQIEMQLLCLVKSRRCL